MLLHSTHLARLEPTRLPSVSSSARTPCARGIAASRISAPLRLTPAPPARAGSQFRPARVFDAIHYRPAHARNRERSVERRSGTESSFFGSSPVRTDLALTGFRAELYLLARRDVPAIRDLQSARPNSIFSRARRVSVERRRCSDGVPFVGRRCRRVRGLLIALSFRFLYYFSAMTPTPRRQRIGRTLERIRSSNER